MKLSIIGAGSTYTPELIEGFVRRRESLRVTELVLQDIDPKRLEVVGGLAGRILVAGRHPTGVALTTDLDEAVHDADGVFVQLRVGGQAARLVDETLPHRFGLLGQETTGTGGFAKALRTVPVVLDIAERVRALAHPEAWLINFTNPVGIVTRALRDDGHRAVGLCNFAIGFERRIAHFLDTDPSRVRVSSVGLNHLSWVRAVDVDGQDRLPELLDSYAEQFEIQTGIPVKLVATLRAFPSYYLRYYYDNDAVVAKQQAEVPRAAEVAAVEADLLALYADPDLCEKPALLERRGGAFYSEAAAQLVTSMLTDRSDVQVVDTCNAGALPGLPPEAVIEVPCRVDGSGAHPLKVSPLPAEMLGLIQAVTAYETLTVESARTGDRTTALRALMAHPLIGQWRLAEPLLDAVLSTNRQYLPAFFG